MPTLSCSCHRCVRRERRGRAECVRIHIHTIGEDDADQFCDDIGCAKSVENMNDSESAKSATIHVAVDEGCDRATPPNLAEECWGR